MINRTLGEVIVETKPEDTEEAADRTLALESTTTIIMIFIARTQQITLTLTTENPSTLTTCRHL